MCRHVVVRVDQSCQAERCSIELLGPRGLILRTRSDRDRSRHRIGIGHDLRPAHRIDSRRPPRSRCVVRDVVASIELVVLPVDTTHDVIVVLDHRARRTAQVRRLAHRQHPMRPVIGKRPHSATGIGVRRQITVRLVGERHDLWGERIAPGHAHRRQPAPEPRHIHPTPRNILDIVQLTRACVHVGRLATEQVRSSCENSIRVEAEHLEIPARHREGTITLLDQRRRYPRRSNPSTPTREELHGRARLLCHSIVPSSCSSSRIPRPLDQPKPAAPSVALANEL